MSQWSRDILNDPPLTGYSQRLLETLSDAYVFLKYDDIVWMGSYSCLLIMWFHNLHAHV